MLTRGQVDSVLQLDNRFDELENRKNEIIQARDMDGMIHPSALGGCELKIWHALVMAQPEHQIPPKLRRTFEHGHLIHEWLQEKLEKMFAADAEVRIEIEKKITNTPLAQSMMLAGSADGVFYLPDDTKVVLEIKSISPDGFAKLNGKPQEKHVMQATVYAKCFDAQYILFDYYNKASDEHQRILIEPSEEAWSYVQDLVRRLMIHLEDGTSPAPTTSKYECRTCQYYNACRPEFRRK